MSEKKRSGRPRRSVRIERVTLRPGELEQVSKLVQHRPVLLVNAALSTGRSTIVPLALRATCDRVIVAERRRLSAWALAAAASNEVDAPMGELVGYQIAGYTRRGAGTQVLYCTDGSRPVRLAAYGRGENGSAALVIDQAHRRDLRQDALLGAARAAILGGARLKLVLMGARLDVEKLGDFFGRRRITVVDVVPQAQVEIRSPRISPADEVVDLVRAGRNVLVLVGGASHIGQTLRNLGQKLASVGLRARLLPLRAGSSPEEQRWVVNPGEGPWVICTTDAVPGLPCADVVDYGIVHHGERKAGVEVASITTASRAECLEHLGMVAPGPGAAYVLDGEPVEERPASPVPEILRGDLVDAHLRMAADGFSIRELTLPDKPDAADLARAERASLLLGAVGESGSVTEMGRDMARLPLAPHYARMVVEAARRGVRDEVLTIVSLCLAREIRLPGRRWLHLVGGERESDLIGLLRCYEHAERIAREVEREAGDDDEVRKALAERLTAIGLKAAVFLEARRRRRALMADPAVRALRRGSRPHSDHLRERILGACLAGLTHQLYIREDQDRAGRSTAPFYVGEDGRWRTPGGPSVLLEAIRAPWLIAAEPITRRRGMGYEVDEVRFATAVDPESPWLRNVPGLLTRTDRFSYDTRSGLVEAETTWRLRRHKVATAWAAAPKAPEATRVLAQALADGVTGHRDEFRNARLLRGLATLAENDEGIDRPNEARVTEGYLARIGDATSVGEIRGVDLGLDELIPVRLREAVLRAAPASVELPSGHELVIDYRRSWRADARVTPRAIIPSDAIDEGWWKHLPDDISLRVCAVEIERSLVVYDTSGEAREAIRALLNRRQFEAWLNDPGVVKPAIAVPGRDDDPDSVPELIEAMCGTDALDGSPLVAYGGPRWLPFEREPTACWMSSREEAVRNQQAVIVRLHHRRAQ